MIFRKFVDTNKKFYTYKIFWPSGGLYQSGEDARNILCKSISAVFQLSTSKSLTLFIPIFVLTVFLHFLFPCDLSISYILHLKLLLFTAVIVFIDHTSSIFYIIAILNTSLPFIFGKRYHLYIYIYIYIYIK